MFLITAFCSKLKPDIYNIVEQHFHYHTEWRCEELSDNTMRKLKLIEL